jgi:RNA polymerase sigma-70 factor (ECF subfamily)
MVYDELIYVKKINKKGVKKLQDIELLNQCKENPEQGLEWVMSNYVDLIHTIVYGKVSKVGTSEDIKECVSDVFITFYQQIDQVDLNKGTIKAYLARIAQFKAIDLYRKLSRNKQYRTDQEEILESCEDERVNIEQRMIQKEEQMVLLEALDALGEPDREIFVRKYYMSQKSKDIAQALGLKDNTVEKKISRGLKKLRMLLGGVEVERKKFLVK